MNKQILNELKTKLFKFISNKTNKTNKNLTESPEIINKKINRNKFGFPSYTNNNEKKTNK
tara:strand:- start:953 stop:1132 length:180 start_codon:yes stop_codon:yes gene_type:complete